ncbi:MAG: diphthine--ammonia ligase, partial [Methanomassiliicoccales archaeon]|nr:diphthine--ammonia ligase [Methanomassiliicoccales archaeon]
MRLAALFSGGKDSTYAAYLMEQMGHEVQVLVSVLPGDPFSMVFHTPNLHLLPLMAEAMGRSMVTVRSDGTEDGDLDALARALSMVRVEGVVTGAVASDYQWDRINGVCERLGLRVFSPLWRKEQASLMRDIIASGTRAMVVAVMAEGLGPEWLGRTLDDEALQELMGLRSSKGISPSGEGGEYESLVLDSPLHLRPLVVEGMSKQLARDGGRVLIEKASLGCR